MGLRTKGETTAVRAWDPTKANIHGGHEPEGRDSETSSTSLVTLVFSQLIS